MRKPLTALAAVFVFTACDGNPFGEIGGDDDPVIEDPSFFAGLPGTPNPSANVSIFRYEARDGNGSGFAESISYDEDNDVFFVDNLAFDGDNFFARDAVTPDLGPFQVYENKAFIIDQLNDTPINQFQHKAIYGVSNTGNTQFAIVRTGQYIDYGFGGFLYQRSGGVNLPTSGQAFYQGDYAGIRDFLGRGGLEYVTGTATLAIDFEDFNNEGGGLGDAVRGQIENRRIFEITDTATTDITQGLIDTLIARGNLPQGATTLPTLLFTVGPNTLNTDGEMSNEIVSRVTENGGSVVYESGTYYAMVSGDNAEEIVGVVVVTSTDPRNETVTARETGGFIVYR